MRRGQLAILWYFVGAVSLGLAIAFEVLIQSWVPRSGHYRFAYLALLCFTPAHGLFLCLTAGIVALNPSKSRALRTPAPERWLGDLTGLAAKLVQTSLIFLLLVIPAGFTLHYWLKFYHGSAFVRGDPRQWYPNAKVVHQGRVGDHVESSQIYRGQHFRYVPLSIALDSFTQRAYRYGADSRDSTVPLPKITYVPFWGPLLLACWTAILTTGGLIVLGQVLTRSPDRFWPSAWLRRRLIVHWLKIPVPDPSARTEIDVFLSYASEDRKIVDTLRRQLEESQIRVWQDHTMLRPGDDFVLGVQAAMASCRIGVLWVSQSFIDKNWTKQEAILLFDLHSKEGRRIVPVWDGVGDEQVQQLHPSFARLQAVTITQGAGGGFQQRLVAATVESVIEALKGESVSTP